MFKFMKTASILAMVCTMGMNSALACHPHNNSLTRVDYENLAATDWKKVDAEYYSEDIPKWLQPNYNALIENIVHYIPYKNDQPLNILDLGCGTGNVTAEILKAYPNSKVCLVDFSEDFLNHAKERFANYDVSTVHSDFKNPDIYEKGKFDLVVSSIAIHHIDDEDKLSVYKLIHQSLKENGWILIGELIKSESPEMEMKFAEDYIRKIKETGESNETMVDDLFDLSHVDIPCSLFKQFKILEEAGFKGIDCLWKTWRHGVFCGKK